MKIAFIGQKGIPAHSGGVERHVEELATRLAAEGHEVFVYVRKHYVDPSIKEYKGVKLIFLPTVKSKNLDAIVHTFLASLDILRRRVDVIHYHAIGPSSLLLMPKLLKRHAVIVSTFHCRDYFHQKWSRFARWYLKVGERIACTMADETIVVSKGLRQYVLDTYGREATYIPNGTPAVKTVSANEITKKWNLKKDDYILSVGRLVKHKGIHTLIKAYKTLKTKKKLVIVGDASYTNGYVRLLKRLAKGNSNILFLGAQFDKTLAELYSNAKLFVQPSQAEGLSVALLEAMSYGTPVLVSDIPENSEVVEDRGRYVGFTFKTNNSSKLASQLASILKKKATLNQYGQDGRRLVRREYDWDRITKSTIALYEDASPVQPSFLRESLAKGRRS